MTRLDFSLRPFPSSRPAPQVTITGSLIRRADTLAIHYALSGDLARLIIPDSARRPARRHRLWEQTCFELFLGFKDSPGYWEFNLSPAGHWNVYRLTDYRQGLAEETAFAALPFRRRRNSDSLRLSLEMDLGRIVPADQPLTLAVAAVLNLSGGGLTYWALTHPGPRPDFHRRDTFLLEL